MLFNVLQSWRMPQQHVCLNVQLFLSTGEDREKKQRQKWKSKWRKARKDTTELMVGQCEENCQLVCPSRMTDTFPAHSEAHDDAGWQAKTCALTRTSVYPCCPACSRGLGKKAKATSSPENQLRAHFFLRRYTCYHTFFHTNFQNCNNDI